MILFWIPQLQFLNVLEELEINGKDQYYVYLKNTCYRHNFYEKHNCVKWVARFFSKNRRKFTVIINKRTLLCKKFIKELSFFLKVHDKFVTVQQGWNTSYLFIIQKGL